MTPTEPERAEATTADQATTTDDANTAHTTADPASTDTQPTDDATVDTGPSIEELAAAAIADHANTDLANATNATNTATESGDPEPGSSTAYPTVDVERHDLSDLLDQLHEEMDLERTPSPAGVGAPLSDPRDLDRPKIEPAAVIERTGGLEFDPEFASFPARFVGFAVDSVVLTLAMVPGVVIILRGSSLLATGLGVLVMVVAFALMNTWYARSVAKTGQWLGNRVINTRVVDAVNGQLIDRHRAGFRYFVRHLISIVLLLGYLVALFDSQRRTFHDHIAGSVVIRPPRATWSAGGDSS